MIDKPGIHDIPADQYHLDPCPEPSLSASIAKVLLQQSPWHAKLEHKRLTPPAPDAESDDKAAFDIGKVFHAMLTGEASKLVVIDPEDYPSKDGNVPAGWTNQAIRAARDAAYATGQTPLLKAQHAKVEAMAATARWQIARTEECAGMFTPGWGVYEQTLVWQEDNGVWCRARPDALSHGRIVIGDLKSRARGADPESFARQIEQMGDHVQASFYRRGVRKLFGTNPHFRFVVVEVEPPHALAVHALTPEYEDHADELVQRAIDTWGWCLRNDRWPGYSRRTHYHNPPAWVRIRAEERNILAEVDGGNEALLRLGIEFQRPIEAREIVSE